VAEELEIKVKADTGEAVANLGKAEQAVEEITAAAKELSKEGTEALKDVGDEAKKTAEELKKAAEEQRKAAYAEGNAERQRRGNIRKKVNDAASGNAEEELAKLAPGLDKTLGKFTSLLTVVSKFTAIFGAAVAVGKAFAAGIDAVSNSLEKSARIEGEAIDRKIRFDKALRLARDGTIALGHSTEEMFANYDAYIAKLDRAKKGMETNEEASRRYAKAVEEVGRAVKQAQDEMSFKLVSPEEINGTMGSVKALARGLNDIFARVFKDGGTEEVIKWAKANEDGVNKVIAVYKAYGATVPDELRRAKEALDRDKSTTEWVEREVAAYDELEEAVRKQREAQSAAINRTSKAPAEFKHIQDAAFGAAVAAGELGTNLDNVAAAVVATGGTMTVGAPYMIQYAQATREATQALLDMAVAHKGLREEQAQALEATKGWTDYILTLKDGYESGTTSLYNYVTALGAFKTQLLQMFAGAKGEAKESLQAIIDLINELVRTAGAGGRETFSPGPLGDLERAIRDANRNRGR